MTTQPPRRAPTGRVQAVREFGWSAFVLVVTILAMAGLTAFSWFTISATSAASARVREASRVTDAYARTRDALSGVTTAEHAFVATPTPHGSNLLLHALDRVDIAIATLAVTAQADRLPSDTRDRRVVAMLSRDNHRLGFGLDHVKALAANYDARWGAPDRTVVRPTLAKMLRLVDRESAIHRRAADASLRMSQATDRRASAVVVITGLLCATISVISIRMLRLRRRLAAAHRREVARLQDAAHRDSLTGLRNHRSFQEDIRSALAADAGLHALLIDLDGLKATNDTLGHQAGDERICQLAAALTIACADQRATPYRIGGDEFAVIAASTLRRPERLADAIHTALFDGRCERVTASVGIATASPGIGADELLRRADLALIVGKPIRCGTQVYSRDLESAPTRAQAERSELLALLDRHDPIAPVFQPIVDLQTGRVIGHEALSRFPDDEWRTPQEWFQLAHAHDLAVELEAAAVKAAMASPSRAGLGAISLNISPKVLLTARDRIGLPADLTGFTIEVTEDALVTEGPELELALRELRTRGARIAVDDAGAGYAGFAQLVRVRPDVIKLDRSLVTGVDADPVKAAVIEAFVHFAQHTNALICAEGIETDAELLTLSALGAGAGQGYLLGRPTPGGAPENHPSVVALRWSAHSAAQVVPLRPAANA